MRGDNTTPGTFRDSIDLGELIEADHPLRAFKRMVDEALRGMDKDFRNSYTDPGRRSIAPESLLKALLLQALYSIRSERALCRCLKTDLLFRWLLEMSLDKAVLVPTVFTHNRQRLAEHGLTSRFVGGVVKQAQTAGLASDEHFTVDGSLIQSHASIKSLKRIGQEGGEDGEGDGDDRPSTGGGPRRSRNESVDFCCERRGNATQRSGNAPEARLFRKGGTGAYFSRLIHVTTENRHGLVVAVAVGEAIGTSERERALKLVRHARRRHRMRFATLGADAGYDAEEFLQELERADVTSQVALRNTGFGRGVEGGEVRAAMRQRQRRVGYWRSQRRRKVVEEFFGWAKTVSMLCRNRHVGHWKIA